MRRLLALALSLPLAACSSADALESVELKGRRFFVEIADDEPEQIRGLMFRRELAEDHGMLFVYPRAEPLAYWMKNCYIGLDILYFDADAKFINGHYGAPPCSAGDRCPSYPSDKPARYVLELGANVGKELGLQPGDPLTLP
jgi:hypothetical protein